MAVAYRKRLMELFEPFCNLELIFTLSHAFGLSFKWEYGLFDGISFHLIIKHDLSIELMFLKRIGKYERLFPQRVIVARIYRIKWRGLDR